MNIDSLHTDAVQTVADGTTLEVRITRTCELRLRLWLVSGLLRLLNRVYPGGVHVVFTEFPGDPSRFEEGI